MRSNHSVVKPILQLVRRIFHRLPVIRWRRFAARRNKLPERNPLQYAWCRAWNSRFAAVRHASPCSKATTSYFTADHFRMLRGHHLHPSYIGYACLSQCQSVNLLEYVTVVFKTHVPFSLRTEIYRFRPSWWSFDLHHPVLCKQQTRHHVLIVDTACCCSSWLWSYRIWGSATRWYGATGDENQGLYRNGLMQWYIVVVILLGYLETSTTVVWGSWASIMFLTSWCLSSFESDFPPFSSRAIIATLSVLCVCLFVIHGHTLNYVRLSHIPGPLWAAFSRLWLVKVVALGDAENEYVRVNRKYGSAMMFSILAFWLQ